MLNIHINNPELEQSLKQTYGNDMQSISNAFLHFVQHQQIQQDIIVSMEQLENGNAIPLKEMMHEVRKKYE